MKQEVGFAPQRIGDGDDSVTHRRKSRANFEFARLAMGAMGDRFSKELEEIKQTIVKPGLRGGFNVDDVRSYGTIQKAVAAIPATQSKMLYITNTQSISADLTIPANIYISVLNGGGFNIASGARLSVRGPFDAGPHQVFYGDGDASLTGVSRILPEWFGGKADGMRVSDLVTVNGNPTVSSVSAPFTSAMQGMPIVVDRAGPGNAQLVTTIATYVGPTQVTLTTAPSVSRTTVAHWGTDNSAAFEKACESGYLIPDYNIQCNIQCAYGIYIVAGKVSVRNKYLTMRPHANGTIIKVIGSGTAPTVTGWSANTFNGFVAHNVQVDFEGIVWEGAGSNAGGIITSVPYNHCWVFGEDGGSSTGATRSNIDKNEFRFFSKVLLFRGVNYVVDIGVGGRNYFQWNEDAIHVGEDAGHAEGNVTFTGTNGTIIPAGTVVESLSNPGGGLSAYTFYYTTDEEVTISGGTATVGVTAALAGLTYATAVAGSAAGARGDRLAAAIMTITDTWSPSGAPAWVAAVSGVVVAANGLTRNEPDANVHFNVAPENVFAEGTRDIKFENASIFQVGGDWENNFWPPIATYAATTSNSVYSILLEASTRTCEAGPIRGIRPVGFIFRTSEGLLVDDLILESFYRNFGVAFENSAAVGTRMTNSFVWGKINHSNDFGGVGSGVVGGIYAGADVDFDDVTTLACAVGMDVIGTGCKFNGVTILDPYKSQPGRVHTGDGIGIRWANNARKSLAHGVRVLSTGMDWSGQGVITSEKAFSSTGVATADIYVVDPVIDLTGVTDPFNTAGGRLIVLGYEVVGTPEGVVSTSPGSILQRTDPGQNAGFYHKLSGSGNTGYVAAVTTDSNGDVGVGRNLVVGQLAALTNADAFNLAGSVAKALGLVNTGNGAADAVFGSLGWGRLTQADGGTRAGLKALRHSANYTVNGNIGLYLGLYASEDGDGDGALVATVKKNHFGLPLGKRLQIVEGSNGRMGVSTLASGTVPVSTTAIAAGDRVILTRQSKGSSTAIGSLELGTVTAATGFVINALKADSTVETGDLSSVHWLIITP